MKNTQKTTPSASNRVFSAVSAVSIVGLAGFLISYGLILYAVAILAFGFYCRWFILYCAMQDREFNAMQKNDRDEYEKFLY